MVVMYILLTVAIQHGNVYPAVLVTLTKVYFCCFVKEIGIENDRPVLAVRNIDCFCMLLMQKRPDDLRPPIVSIKIPVLRRIYSVYYQPAAARIKIGILWSDPEIYIYRGKVGMQR